MNKKTTIVFLLFFMFILISIDIDAQCAMCKLNAESAANEKSGFAEGLNNGILYLMGIPYILLLTGIAVFSKVIFKKYKLKNTI